MEGGPRRKRVRIRGTVPSDEIVDVYRSEIDAGVWLLAYFGESRIHMSSGEHDRLSGGRDEMKARINLQRLLGLELQKRLVAAVIVIEALGVVGDAVRPVGGVE